MKKKRVKPRFTLYDGMDSEERYRVTEKDWAFDDAEREVKGKDHHKSNSDKIGIRGF